MIINKINITAFGGIKDKSFTFSGGANVIYGLNEAGKSTICAFIHAMLYGMNKPLKSDNRIDLRQKYLPWDTLVASGSMEFTYKGNKLVLERKFGKTKRSDKCVLRYAENWEECREFDAENIGAELLGLNEESFVKTIFMGQLATKVSGKDDEILKRLSNLSSTGMEEASFGKINKILQDAKHSIIPKATAKSIMRDLLDKKEQLEKEETEIASANEGLKDSIIENNALMQKISDKKKELGTLAKEREKARDYEKYVADEKIKETINTLKERKTKAEERQKEILFRLAEKNEKIESFDENRLLDSLQKLTELEDKAKIADAYKLSAIAYQEELSKLNTRQNAAKKQGNVFINILLLCLAFVLFALSAASVYFVAVGTYILHVSVALGVLMLVLSIVGFVKTSKAKKMAAVLLIEILDKEKKLSEILNFSDSDKIKAQMNEILSGLNVKDANELKKNIADFGTLKGEAELLAKEAEMLKNNIYQTDNDIEASTKMLKGAKECEKTRAFDEVDREYSQKNNELLELKARKKELDFKIEHANEGLKTLDIVESELRALEPEISYYNSVHSSLEIAISVMAECEAELKSGFTPELLSAVSGIISSLSKDKYSDVKLSDDYKAFVKEPAGNSIVEAENLSGGTYDLIYIAVRLGILKSVFGEKIPLVIMDDTFLQLDDERQEIAIRILAETKEISQAFYFTCHGDILEKYKKFEKVNLIDI